MKGVNCYLIVGTIAVLLLGCFSTALAGEEALDVNSLENSALLVAVERSESKSELEPGKFLLYLKENKVYLSANQANVQETLTKLCEVLDVAVVFVENLEETRNLTLKGVSPEYAIRGIAGKHMLDFIKAKKDGTFKLVAIEIVPKTEVDKLMAMTSAGFTAVPYAAPYRGEDIDLKLAKKAAIHFATEAYGNVRFLEATPYPDLGGKEEVYSILLYRGEGSVPERKEIAKEVKKRTNIRKNLEAQLKKVKGRAKARMRAKIAEIWKSISRPNEFVTLLCGAHTGHVPVITMTEGLPIEYVLLEEIENQMKHIYGNSQVKFVNPVYRGPFHISFEFQVSGEVVLVDPQTGSETDKALALYDHALATKRRAAEMGPERAIRAQERIQKRKELMKKKWDFVRGLK